MKKEFTKAKLPAPFPAAPNYPAKFEIKFEKNGNLVALHLFAQVYSAKKFLEQVFEGTGFKWRDDNIIHTEMGVTIKCAQLEKIMEHEYSNDEEEWTLPEPYMSQATSLGAGKTRTQIKTPERQEPTSTGRSEAKDPAKSNKPKKASVSKEGLITIQDICKELKLEPSKARQLLRKSKTEKPEAGWSWSKKDAEGIKAMLVKEGKK